MSSRWAEQLGCKCSECPLKDCEPVPPQPSVVTPKFAVYTDREERGYLEEKRGAPISGEQDIRYGQVLRKFFHSRKNVFTSLSTLCKPSEDIPKGQWNKAIECCRPRVENELKSFPANLPILLLGNRALQLFTGFQRITNWRGYPVFQEFQRKAWLKKNKEFAAIVGEDRVLYPAHASEFINKAPHYFPVWMLDWQRFLGFVSGRLKRWVWPEIIIDEGTKMRQALNAFIDTKPLLGVDIEGNRDNVKCIGLAVPNQSVSVPWPPADDYIEYLVRLILADENIPLVMQNGNYDVLELEDAGFTVTRFIHDTLCASYTVAPQISHKLSDIASYEFAAPRWKDIFGSHDDRKWVEKFERAEPTHLRRYNAKDALMTVKSHYRLMDRVKHAYNGPARYAHSMRLLHLGRRMATTGVIVDDTRRANHSKKLDTLVAESKQKFLDVADVTPTTEDEDFKLGSTAQLRELFFGKWNCTVRYRTDRTNEPRTNKDTLLEIAADKFEDPDARQAAKYLLNFRGYEKLASTYVRNLPVLPSGKVQPNWKRLTKTGRWNSSGPNMQNIPDGTNTPYGMRDMFVAPKGMWFVAADHGQLEARILALRAGETKLIDAFNAGIDYHTAIGKELFDTDKLTKKQRKNIKTFNFGYNYGAGDKELQKQMAQRGFSVSLMQIQLMREKLKERFPQMAKMKEDDMQMARELGYIQIPFGGTRFYFYLDKVSPTQVANFPMQAGAAVLLNNSILEIDAALDASKGEALVMQIHDEFVLQGPDKDRLIDVLKQKMPQKHRIGDYELDFPIEIKAGTRWSDMEVVGEFTC